MEPIQPQGPDDKNVSELEAVQQSIRFLMDYGYLRREPIENVAPESLAEAYGRFQKFYSLEVTNRLNHEVFRWISQARCAIPDVFDHLREEFQPQAALPIRRPAPPCAWVGRQKLTYAFEGIPPYVIPSEMSATQFKQAVMQAFSTWESRLTHVPLKFSRVLMSGNPDIVIQWLPHWDDQIHPAPRLDPLKIAHSDFPTDCEDNPMPKPIHFECLLNLWTIGSKTDYYDVESVALHEIGHILGLAHSGTEGDVMFGYPRVNQTLITPTAADDAQLLALYPNPASPS